MNAGLILKARVGDGFPTDATRTYGWRRPHRPSATSVALWLFLVVATSLFSLFLMAYALRMDSSDWSRIGMPWQLWLSSGLLVAGSLALEGAYVQARHAHMESSRGLFLAGGCCGLAFLGVQLWAWRELLANHVMPIGNPAASFFYLLTAMHGLHVVGGLLAWAWTMRHVRQWPVLVGTRSAAQPIGLCARYWHFLLAVWLVLFAALGWLTPEVVRFICGTA